MSLTNNTAWLRATADALIARGFKVAFEPGWETRSNGSLAPDHEAIILHHTGGIGTSTAYIRDGEKARLMLPPYAQIHVRRDATLVVIAAGGASHAGYVHQPCWDRIVGQTAPLDRDMIPGADSATFSPNRPGIGVEVNGAGGPDDWTPAQRAVTVAFCVEYHRVRGWTQGIPKVGAHKELTKRKPGDPVADMGRIRTEIQTALQEDDMPITDADIDRIARATAQIILHGRIPLPGGSDTSLATEVQWMPANFAAGREATVQGSAAVAEQVAKIDTSLDPSAIAQQVGERVRAQIDASLPAEVTYRREAQA